MSNFRAIATVTESLRALADHAINDIAGGAATIGRPPATLGTLEGPMVNVCLYAVDPNASVRNMELPTRRADGTVGDRPFLAVDLHYVLSFYGPDELQLQVGMGRVLTALHASPVLSTSRIADVIKTKSPLTNSDLDRAIDRVRFTLRPLAMDELSKLWSVLFQVPFTPSVALIASVILLEPELRPSRPAPVRTAVLGADTVRVPRLDSAERVRAADTETAALRRGDQLRLRGARLNAESVEVRIGTAVAQLDEVHEDQLIVTLGGNMRAGWQSVQVVDLQPPHMRGGIATTMLPLAIHPRIAAPPTITGGILDIPLDLSIGAGQRVYAMLNGAAGATVYDAKPRTGDTTIAQFDVSSLARGTWLVRILIDGAESLLDTAADGSYVGPTVTV